MCEGGFCTVKRRLENLDSEVLIVGGGPAGLSAALILGRCRRHVLISDAGSYRNAAAYAVHGFLSREGISPQEFLSISRQQVLAYPHIVFENAKVLSITGECPCFQAVLSDSRTVTSKRVVLPTGMTDEVPPIDGIMDLWGKTVFQCPYCDGWEFRDQPIAVYGQGQRGPGFALLLHKWSRDLILCTDGPMQANAAEAKRLEQLGVVIREQRISRLEGRNGCLETVVFEGEERCPRSALFFNTPCHANIQLAESLGCRLTPRREVEVNFTGLTSVAGVYAAGDASPDIKIVILAAAEGAKAGQAVHKDLLKEERFIV